MSKTLDLCEALAEHFGYDSFRDCQEEAVEAIFHGEDVFVVLPTGGGKSICYQLPALLLDGLTIVISPLIALMHDQADNLADKGITAAYIDSTLNDEQVKQQWAMVKSGEAKILYCSPEKLSTKGFFDKLEDIEVSRLIVDEAHCVSMWGHDFRREYLDIPEARKRLGNPPIAALTATAPVLVRDDVIDCLQIQDCKQIIGEMDRPNLVIDVEQYWSESEKFDQLKKKLRQHSRAGKKTIVYCRRIRTVEQLAEDLETSRGISYEIYHGKMDGEERLAVEKKFRDGITPILFATKAFGMGVDIPDIRYVYHYEIPESVESYWQEIGRAGRDGKRSRCVLMYQSRDVNQIQHFVRASNPPLTFIRKVWNSLTRVVRDWRPEVPTRYLNEEKFAQEFSGSDDFLIGQVRAAIAQLCEHGLISVYGNQCSFLIKPQHVNEFGFPIEEVTIDNKRDSALHRLKVMIYYANHAGDNPRRIIMGHFLHNSIVDLVKDLDLGAWYQVPDEVLLALCTALATRDFKSTEINGYLRGTAAVAKKDKTPLFGSLKKFNSRELRMDVKQAATLGYIRPFKLDDRTFYTLTENGSSYLARNEVEVPQATSYEELKRSMHAPANKALLAEALDVWRIMNRGRKRADQWWRIIEEFMRDDFELFGKRYTGLQLTADFVHKKAVLKKHKERSATSGRKGAGVRLTDGKLFLNYLFDNLIET